MARFPPNSLEEVRVDAEIGADPAELDAIADAVVRGGSIRYARITALRGLTKAVPRHEVASLSQPPKCLPIRQSHRGWSLADRKPRRQRSKIVAARQTE